MDKLRLSILSDDRPVKLTIEMPGAVFRDLEAYAALLSVDGQGAKVMPERLIAPMLSRFMAADRGFVRRRRTLQAPVSGKP